MHVAIFAKYLLPHPSPLTCHRLLPMTTFEYVSTWLHSLLTLLRLGGNIHLFTFFRFTHTLSHDSQGVSEELLLFHTPPPIKTTEALQLHIFQWLPVTDSELGPMRIPPEGSVTFACRLVERRIKFRFSCLKAIGLATVKTIPRGEAVCPFCNPLTQSGDSSSNGV